MDNDNSIDYDNALIGTEHSDNWEYDSPATLTAHDLEGLL